MLHVDIQVRQSNPAALELFRKLGFQQVDHGGVWRKDALGRGGDCRMSLAAHCNGILGEPAYRNWLSARRILAAHVVGQRTVFLVAPAEHSRAGARHPSAAAAQERLGLGEARRGTPGRLAGPSPAAA